VGYENIRMETDEGVAILTIDRPKSMNALNHQTLTELAHAFDAVAQDEAVGALVVTGAGEKAFVAGADIAEMSELGAAEAQCYSRFLQESLDALERSPKPVIAAVNGFALGGGCELAMACHVRIAARSARFGQPEVNLGLIPGAGGSQRLPRIVGRGRALDLILSGDMIDADEAHRIGLVNHVVAPDELAGFVGEYAGKLQGKSPLALRRALEAVVSGAECAQDDAMRFEASLFALCFASEDMREGTRAFMEKRKASFTGR